MTATRLTAKPANPTLFPIQKQRIPCLSPPFRYSGEMENVIDITARLNGRRMIREVNRLLYDAYLEAATIPAPLTFREFCDTLPQFGMSKG